MTRDRLQHFFQVYIIPGAVFQSVMVGGGYGTGREIVEYFTQFGPGGGVLAFGVTALFMWAVLGASFEFARCFKVYDYRSFFKQLLGKGWVLYEVLFIITALIVLAVVASATGEMLADRFGFPPFAGLSLILVCIGILLFYGRAWITRALTFWSFVLYGVFIAYAILAFQQSGTDIQTAFAEPEVQSGWAVSGLKYAMYNLAVVPAILFASRAITTRGEAVGSGFAGALFCLIPGLLFHLSFSGAYPAILQEEIPLYAMIDQLGADFLLVAYILVLLGTFIETGAGYIQGINERIDNYFLETNRPPLGKTWRAGLGMLGILISAGLATAGIVALIAQGYGAIAWGFLGVYVIPLLTFGLFKIWNTSRPD